MHPSKLKFYPCCYCFFFIQSASCACNQLLEVLVNRVTCVTECLVIPFFKTFQTSKFTHLHWCLPPCKDICVPFSSPSFLHPSSMYCPIIWNSECFIFCPLFNSLFSESQNSLSLPNSTNKDTSANKPYQSLHWINCNMVSFPEMYNQVQLLYHIQRPYHRCWQYTNTH